MMKDQEALDFLAVKLGGKTALAGALGASAQIIDHWYKRGISHRKRPSVWAMVNDHGGHLSREWLMERAA